MHVLTGRGGELAAPFGPVLGTAQLAGLTSLCPVETAVVADQDITPGDVEAAALNFLHRAGWIQPGDQLGDELAADMADNCLDTAADWPIGTRLTAHCTELAEDQCRWTFTPQ